jgi:hypothetical protein
MFNDYITKQYKEKLHPLGYSVKIDQWGYMVYFNDEFIGGAGVAEKKKQHWQHARKNVDMYWQNAWSTANDHYLKTQKEKENETNNR